VKGNRRSLDFARDDKKERVADRRGQLPREREVVDSKAVPLNNCPVL
jgi:hypothetical protein